MRKFARIIELPETQCLLTVEFDDESDSFKMKATFDLGGVMASLSFGFDTEEIANECMNNYTVEKAAEAYEATHKMIYGK